MAFGIEIINNDSRVIIDDTYANLLPTSINFSTVTPNTAYPGAISVQSGDFVIARANTNSNGMVGLKYIPEQRWTDFQTPNDFKYYVLRRASTLYATNSINTGYGLQVFNSTSSVVFNSNISTNFEIIAVGVFNSNVANVFNIAFPSNTGWYSDFSKYYCVINNTFVRTFTTAPPVPITLNHWIGYRYVWANSSYGRIVIENNSITAGGPLTKHNADFNYMILKEIK